MHARILPYVFFFVLTLAGVKPIYAQQDAQITQYMFNPFFYNPAYAGVKGAPNITAMFRPQWLGYNSSFDGPGAPLTGNISFNMPIQSISSGAGINLIGDRVGPQITTEAQLSYAYHFDLNGTILSVGLRGGIYSVTLDWDKYRPLDEGDPLISGSGTETQVRPDIGAGIYLLGPKFYAGININHIIESDFDFGIDDLQNVLENHFFVMGGYHFDISYNFRLTPTALVKTDFKEYSFDVGVIGTYDEKLWGGLSYRQSEAVSAMIGLSFLQNNAFSIGYAFDFTINGQDAKALTSHELLLSYTFPPPLKKIIRTPRFRHH